MKFSLHVSILNSVILNQEMAIPSHHHEIKIISHCKIARWLLKSLKSAILKYTFITWQASLPTVTPKEVWLHTSISDLDADIKIFLPLRKWASYPCHCGVHLGRRFLMTENYWNPLLGIKLEIPKPELLMEKCRLTARTLGRDLSWPFLFSV